MSRTIPAIFNAGVFRPLLPVDLAEGTQVEVQVPIQHESEGTRWRPLIDCHDAELIDQAALDPELDF
ncbi:MAG: antitoxin family protein [Planctomycetes bacterium]|nr:antitoxin family protein [Planctomycetota bacterium]